MMVKKLETSLSIPNIIRKINASEDTEKTLLYENMLSCMLGSPLAAIAAVLNFVFIYIIFKEDFSKTLINSVCFILFAIFFETLLRIKINVTLNSFIISVLYALISIFTLIRLYEYLGPAIWTIFCIELGFSIYRSTRDMTILLGITTVFSMAYVMLNLSKFQFSLTNTYFFVQMILLVLLFIIFIALHKINMGRINYLHFKIDTIIQHNNDIAALYEEISATEEELRIQNENIQERDKELFNLAYFDQLTNLPNRIMFTEYLCELIESSKRDNEIFYLASIDIDYFKKLNDTMGHHIGDEFIKFVGERLKNSVHEKDFLCRTGGDEFSILISRQIDEKRLAKELNSIRKNFYSPFKIKDTEFRLTASFGVAVFPKDGDNHSDIIKHADMAMNRTKELGKNSLNFFDEKIKAQLIEKTNIENEILKGLFNEEFFLVFQPQYSVNKGQIRSFEVLTRWDSPKLGSISPLKFIPVAEETGLINPLGDWILKTACTKFKALKTKFDLDVLLSVNISSVQLRGLYFLKNVKRILKETKFDPHTLEFEITESICIDSFDEVLAILNELRSLGIKIALDDFGTGYSSLSYLKLLPIDTLKIDKFFIDEITVLDSPKKVVGDIISLGHSLGFEIVAEGVEHSEQQCYLEEHSCNYIQGFLLNKPLSEEEVENLFRI